MSWIETFEEKTQGVSDFIEGMLLSDNLIVFVTGVLMIGLVILGAIVAVIFILVALAESGADTQL